MNTANASNLEAVEASPAYADASSLYMSGLQGLIAATLRYTQEEQGHTAQVIRRLGEDFAYIRWQDLRKPLTFLRQMAGSPPIRLGVEGFRRELVDDRNPARHYMAFVVMGYWLPYPLAVAVLYLWEILGYMRYGFVWSPPDILSGFTGVRHGNAVRHNGINVLPALMADELTEPKAEEESLAQSHRDAGQVFLNFPQRQEDRRR